MTKTGFTFTGCEITGFTNGSVIAAFNASFLLKGVAYIVSENVSPKVYNLWGTFCALEWWVT